MPTDDAPAPRYLTLDKFSALTGLSASTLRRLVRSGALPHLQPAGKGGRLLFTPDALERARAPATATHETGPAARRPGPAPRWRNNKN